MENSHSAILAGFMFSSSIEMGRHNKLHHASLQSPLHTDVHLSPSGHAALTTAVHALSLASLQAVFPPGSPGAQRPPGTPVPPPQATPVMADEVPSQSADSGYADSEDGSNSRQPTRSGHSSPSSAKPSSSYLSGNDIEDEPPESPDNVSVIVRVRPLNNKEVARQENSGLQFPGEGRILVDSLQQSNSKPKLLTFNVVFEPESTQDDVFSHCGVKQLIDMALDGFSSTIFAYGQTGSGKTYTLTGPPLVNGSMSHVAEAQGLMTRSFAYMFERLDQKQDMTCIIHASFLEIYNEQVVDLLNPGSQRKYLQVRWTRNKGFYVENLFIVECVELDDVLAVMEEGLRHRQTASNTLNENSSRSHCILTLNITSEIKVSEDDSTFVTKHGKLTFVDLAGSEKVNATPGHGDSLQETNKINRSLLTLGKCISALGDSKKRQGHIPYRDSKLTKLLADSLGGNGVTLMIACVTPAKSNLAETLNTLRYAARTKQIKNKPVIIMDPREVTILSLRREVKLLKAENQYLRQQLQFPKTSTPKASAILKSSSMENLEKLREAAEGGGNLPPEVNPKELYAMLKEYMVENEALREENSDLLRARDVLLHDQETVSRENERLQKKMEEGGRSHHNRSSGKTAPLNESMNQPSSLNSSGTNIWINNADLDSSGGSSQLPLDLNGSFSRSMPDAVSKELQRRKIGPNLSDMPKGESNSERLHRRHVRRNSWEGSSGEKLTSPFPTPPSSTGSGGRKPMPMPAVKPSLSPPGPRMGKSKSEQSLVYDSRANKYGIRRALQKQANENKNNQQENKKPPLKRRTQGNKRSPDHRRS